GIGGRRCYAMPVGGKQSCWLKSSVGGPGGHGALINRGGTMARLARLLRELDAKRLPVHVTPVVRELLEQIGAKLPRRQRAALSLLLNPRFTDKGLRLLGNRARMFEPMLRNTVTATIVRGGETIN